MALFTQTLKYVKKMKVRKTGRVKPCSHVTFLARFCVSFYDRHLRSFNVICEHLHRTTFNPFLNGEKNGLKNVTCKQPFNVTLRVHMFESKKYFS